MVTEQDLIDTVAAAYGAGWRQVKLYFMCGLPTETDEDVLQIADLAKKVIDTGRRSAAAGHPLHRLDRWLRAQAAHALPVGRPAGRARRPTPGWPSCARRSAPTGAMPAPSASAITTASRASSRACSRAVTAGSGRVIERVWREGAASTAGGSTSPMTRGWRPAAAELPAYGVDVDWYTTRERGESEVLPWDHIDSGLDKDWLWADWQDALDEQSSRTTAGGPRASTAGSARSWARTSRSARRASSCCR
jgi:hypothetical protein